MGHVWPAQVFGLGFVSVFDQVLEGLPEGDKGSLFAAYLSSLDEDPKQFREAGHSPAAAHLLSMLGLGPDLLATYRILSQWFPGDCCDGGLFNSLVGYACLAPCALGMPYHAFRRRGSLQRCFDLHLEMAERRECLQDAEKLEAWAGGLSGPGDLKPEGSGDEVQQKLASIAEKAAAGNFLYTKFFAIGLFRCSKATLL